MQVNDALRLEGIIERERERWLCAQKEIQHQKNLSEKFQYIEDKILVGIHKQHAVIPLPLGGCFIGGRSVAASFGGGATGILSPFFSGGDAGDM